MAAGAKWLGRSIFVGTKPMPYIDVDEKDINKL